MTTLSRALSGILLTFGMLASSALAQSQHTMFETVTVIGAPLVLSQPAEVDAAEMQLGIRFPSGYREYVTQLGEGVLGGSYIRIYPPLRILSGTNNVAAWRRWIAQYWFWGGGGSALTKQQALDDIIIGDTLDRYELIVHPANPERIYVLPRQREKIYVAGDGLPAAIEWRCTSGALTEPFPEREFRPVHARVRPVRPRMTQHARISEGVVCGSIRDFNKLPLALRKRTGNFGFKKPRSTCVIDPKRT
jgi:hypothetical protein